MFHFLSNLTLYFLCDIADIQTNDVKVDLS